MRLWYDKLIPSRNKYYGIKVFDWKNFMLGRTAVHFKSEIECDNFLKIAEKRGIIWMSGTSLSEKNCFDTNRNDICYEIFVGRYLGYSSFAYCIKKNYTILEWSDYMEFTKEDLKVGMLVETSDGKALVMPCGDGKVLTYKNGYYDYLCDVEFDNISKVWGSSNIGNQTLNFSGEFRRVIYERTAIKEMSIKEISKALGYEVKIVKDR